MVAKRFPVEAGQIMLFARAVNDPNPMYSDEEYAEATEVGHIIAPPTFLRSSAQYDDDYALRPRVGQRWLGSGREPTGIPPEERDTGGGTGLAAGTEFEYHRHMRPGDELTGKEIGTRTWTREGRRGGTLHFSETTIEFYDQHGELVITTRTSGVHTGRVVDQ